MTYSKRRSSTSLAIVEKGFRGALEEQYGNIIWLSECMKAMGAEHSLLLCGSAVATCFNEQRQQTVLLGDIKIETLSDFKQSVVSLIRRGGNIWVLADDLKLFHEDHELIKGVEIADSMAILCMRHDKIWFW
jgi:hypothetical protein